MPDTDLTAALDEIRERYRHGDPDGFGAVLARTHGAPQDVPRLLAAVDAVLKLHKPGPVAILGALCKRHENHRYFSITSKEAADVEACSDCYAAVFDTCAGCGTSVRLDKCPARTAITRALLGEDGTDG